MESKLWPGYSSLHPYLFAASYTGSKTLTAQACVRPEFSSGPPFAI